MIGPAIVINTHMPKTQSVPEILYFHKKLAEERAGMMESDQTI